ncbi:MAG: GAF domain-containing protein [Candidatus Goldbacteria bacterium]|nr:GAF domain-containing protein [Candidatus Goldiibacteriota bacterium]
MKLKVRRNTIKIKRNTTRREKKEILPQIVSLITSGTSVTDILVNSSELIIKNFKSLFYIVYILEENKLKCLIKRTMDENNFFPQQIILNTNEKNELLKLKNPVMNSEKNFSFISEKLNINHNIFCIIVPIINIGEFIGIILIGRENKQYDLKDRNIIFSISSLLAPSFSNTRQIYKKEEIKKQIEALMNISKSIVENSNLTDILKTIVNVVAEVMDYKICSVMLFDEEKQELIIKATQSLSEEYRTKPNLKIGQSLSGKAIKEKRPISAIDVLKEPSYKYPEIARREGLKSMLAVPMIFKSKTIGVINVYTTNEHIFSEDEIKMLSSVANLAAVAIANAQLEEETVKAKDALETRKLIERAKGILMKINNMSEEEAYTTMRKKAMDLCKPLKEIAEAIILSMELNKKISGGKDVSSNK